MKKPLIIPIFFLCLLPIAIQAQVRVIGNFSIADSNQVHFLAHVDKTKYKGRCLGFVEDSLEFVCLGTRSKYTLSDVAYLRVLDAEEALSFPDVERPMVQQPEPPTTYHSTSNFLYLAKSKGNMVLQGQVTFLRQDRIFMKDKNEQVNAFNLKRIQALWLVGPDLNSFGQKSVVVHELITYNGATYKGQIIRYEDESVQFLLEGDSIVTFPMTDIWFIELIDRKKKSKPTTKEEPRKEMPKVPRQENIYHPLFFTPTNFTAPKGSFFFRNTAVYLNNFSWYMTSNITVGGALVVPVGVGTNVKFIFPFGKRLYFGAGGHCFKIGRNPARLAPFGTLTIGNKRSYISLAYHLLKIYDHGNAAGFFSAGFSVRLNNKVSFYADGLYTKATDLPKNIWAGGLSFFTAKSRIDMGISLFPKPGDDSFEDKLIPLPLVAFTYKKTFGG